MSESLPSLKTWQRTPPTFNDVDAFAESVDQYFQMCSRRDLDPNHVGLARYLGVPKRTLNEYTRKEGFKHILEMAKEIMEDDLIQKLANKDYATAGVIFNLTNNYGWKQPNQIEHSGSIAVAHSHVPPDVQNELDAHRAEIEGPRADENPA
jgi:hypothetical protein